MAYRNYSVDVSHIVDASGQGDFTSIQAAVSASTAGDTLFIRPGTYTENITLVPGINLIGFDSSSSTIVGKLSYSGTGLVELTNLGLTTNGDYILEVTGANACAMNITNCSLNISDHDGIHYTNSNATSDVKFFNCVNGPTAGFACFVSTAAGFLSFLECFLGNQTSVSSTSSSGFVSCFNSTFGFPTVISGTSSLVSVRSSFNTSGVNITGVTVGGAGGLNAIYSNFDSGTASSLVLNSTAEIAISTVASSNANAIDGTGTISLGIITFTGSSSTISGTLTVNKLTTYGGTII